MESVNVTQFYQTIFCFSLLLLFFQSVVLVCCDLSNKYSQYRANFYESQFLFTKQFQFEPDKNPPQESGPKDQMLNKNESIPNNSQNPQQYRSQNKPTVSDKQSPPVNSSQQGQKRRNSKVSYDLQTDLVLDNQNGQNKNSEQPPHENISEKDQQQKVENKEQIMSDQQSKKANSLQKHQMTEQKDQIKQQRSMQANNPSNDETIQKEENEIRSSVQSNIHTEKVETQNLKIENMNEQKKMDEILNQPEETDEIKQDNRIRIKFVRRIDEAFSEYVPIIMSMIIIGIASKSVFIFSMVCFFGYAFTSLLFNYANLLERLEERVDHKSIFGQVNQLLSGLFVIGLFISFWASNEYEH